MTQKFSFENWKRLSFDLTKTKQSIEEMSKLYIIAHEKVKQIIRKCQTDLTYSPIDDCERELNFIKTILERLAQKHNDEYLSKIDPRVISKYEKNFYDLIELLRLALATNDSKQKIDIQSLMGISQDKHAKKGQFSLRSQLQRSQSRMVRTKSGHRITRKSTGEIKKAEGHQQFDQLNRAGEKIQLVEPQMHEQQFMQKRNRLQQIINGHISKLGYTLDFKKKYDKLEEYLQQRKEFSDLLFSQKYYDEMIQVGKTRKNQARVYDKKDPDLNKLFPEFNIKTKYMKKQVKQNILKVIFDVKKELLKEYHQSNVTKMRETNEGGMVKLSYKRKPSKSTKSQSSEVGSYQKNEARFRSTNRLVENRRHSLGNLKGKLGNTQSSWRRDEDLKKQEEKAYQMFKLSKMPHYQK